MKIYTMKELIEAFRAIRDRGWIPNARPGNAGGVGNTLEDLLGIEENNLAVANAVEVELKCQRADSSSLTTLFHMEPSPRAFRFVPAVLLPKYGWPHQRAGDTYPAGEMSFRQTIHARVRSDRGFGIQIDRQSRKVLLSFDANSVDQRHALWLASVADRAGLAELSPQPYWGFDDLFHKAGTKLHACFYAQAQVKIQEGREFFWYTKATVLEGFSFEGLLRSLEDGVVLVDCDARTGHNHGTKFRLRQDARARLYSHITVV